MSKPKPPLLSKEQLEAHLSQIDLLTGMYPSKDELVIDTPTRNWLDVLRKWLDSDTDEDIEAVPASLAFEIAIRLDSENTDEQRKIQFNIEMPVRADTDVKATTEPDSNNPATSIRVRLRQPVWMTRTQTTSLNTSVPTDVDDAFSTIEHLRSEASLLLSTSQRQVASPPPSAATQSPSTPSEPLVRVWFYFPSLSTRTKRSDLVNYAPTYSLTGFVLAGKPGILCLEGLSQNIDEYMRFIKTESWGDIPSHHKKVSERMREVLKDGETGRVFHEMQEITDAEWMGEKRGERGNRSDLRLLEGWLDQRGLKGAVGKVLM